MILPVILDPNGPLDDSIGAFYIAILFSAIVYGVCLLQAFSYFQEYVQDPWYTKTAVIALITFDTIHIIFVAMGVYSYVISNYHDPHKLQDPTWPVLMEGTFVIANSATVQVFYIYRIWQLSKHKITIVPLCAFFLLLVCGETGVVITWLVLAMKMTKWRDLLKIAPLAIAILSLFCSIDILIAGTLGILLHCTTTGFKRYSTINRIILFIISTGSLTAIFAILALVSLLSMPYNLICGALILCRGHLYTNSFLTTLNARPTVNHVDETELKSSNIPFRKMTKSKRRSIKIRIDTTREAVPDDDFPAQEGHPMGVLL